MKYPERILRNGVRVRSFVPEDAEETLALMQRIYGETPYLASEPDEFRLTLEEEAAYLRGREEMPRGCTLGAWLDGRLAGTAAVQAVSGRRRLCHRASMGISVAKAFWGRGAGSALMEALLDAAASMGFRQVELEAAADNERAIRLYRRFGFEEYGRRPAGMRRDGVDVDELLMVRRLM